MGVTVLCRSHSKTPSQTRDEEGQPHPLQGHNHVGPGHRLRSPLSPFWYDSNETRSAILVQQQRKAHLARFFVSNQHARSSMLHRAWGSQMRLRKGTNRTEPGPGLPHRALLRLSRPGGHRPEPSMDAGAASNSSITVGNRYSYRTQTAPKTDATYTRATDKSKDIYI